MQNCVPSRYVSIYPSDIYAAISVLGTGTVLITCSLISALMKRQLLYHTQINTKIKSNSTSDIIHLIVDIELGKNPLIKYYNTLKENASRHRYFGSPLTSFGGNNGNSNDIVGDIYTDEELVDMYWQPGSRYRVSVEGILDVLNSNKDEVNLLIKQLKIMNEILKSESKKAKKDENEPIFLKPYKIIEKVLKKFYQKFITNNRKDLTNENMRNENEDLKKIRLQKKIAVVIETRAYLIMIAFGEYCQRVDKVLSQPIQIDSNIIVNPFDDSINSSILKKSRSAIEDIKEVAINITNIEKSIELQNLYRHYMRRISEKVNQIKKKSNYCRERNFFELVNYLWIAKLFKFCCSLFTGWYIYFNAKMLYNINYIQQRIENELTFFLGGTNSKIDGNSSECFLSQVLPVSVHKDKKTIFLPLPFDSIINQICYRLSSKLTSASGMSMQFTAISFLIIILIFGNLFLSITERLFNDFISSNARHYREEKKLQLYLSLTRAPIAFYDINSYEDVERMIFFLNDLEGVDVIINNYIIRLARAFFNCYSKHWSVYMITNSKSLLLLILGMSSLSELAKYLLNRVANKLAMQSGPDDIDVEEFENGGPICIGDGAITGENFLQGLDIIKHTYDLRPYNTDSYLMKNWVNKIEKIMYYRDYGVIPNERTKKNNFKQVNDTFIDQFNLDHLKRNEIFFKVKNKIKSLAISTKYSLTHTYAVFRRSFFRAIRTSLQWTSALSRAIEGMISIVLPVIVTAVTIRDQTSVEENCSVIRTISPFTVLGLLSSVDELFNAIISIGYVKDVVEMNSHKAYVLRYLLDFWNKGEFDAVEDGLVQTFTDNFESSLSPNPELNEKITKTSSTIPLQELRSEVISCNVVPVRICFNNITFAYPSRPDRDILKNCSLTLDLKPGSLVALTGPNGSGKSTLLKLLLKLYNVDKNLRDCVESNEDSSYFQPLKPELNITFLKKKNNLQFSVSLFDLPSLFLRDLFSFVPQSPIIFAGTVAQNIALEPCISLTDKKRIDRINTVLVAAGCDSFVDQLPEGLFTFISGDVGSPSSVRSRLKNAVIKLSVGQAQRICLARALYRRTCSIVLMDEPTSSMDPKAKHDFILSMRRSLSSQENNDCAVSSILCVTHDETLIDAVDTVISMSI